MTAGVPVQLISDNMAAALMQQQKADLVIAGADRIAADGSAANKIGTYSLAVLAQYHQVPFYIAAPLSTFDRKISRGSDIPIEQRNENEVLSIGGKRIAAEDVGALNPAFDVTPAELVDVIVTEKGVVHQPGLEKMQALMK